MSVEVRIPLNIAIDRSLSGGAHFGALESAVSDAALRALSEMDEAVFVPRGGYAQPHLNPPSFVWSGGHGGLSEDWRSAAEAHVTAGLRGAIAAAPNSASAALARAPEPVPNGPMERIDRRRKRGSRYVVPSYEGELPTPDVALYLDGPHSPASIPDTHYTDLWHWSDALEGTLANRIAGFIATVPEAIAPAGRTLGVLFTAPGETVAKVIAIAIITIDGRGSGGVRISIVRTFSPGGKPIGHGLDEEEDEVATKRTALPERGVLQLRKLARVSSVESAAQYLVRRVLAVTSVSPTPVAGESARHANIRAQIDVLAMNWARTLTHPSGHIATLGEAGDDGFLCSIPDIAFSGQSITLLPMARILERPTEEGEGDGEGGEETSADGRGQQGSDGDGVAAEGTGGAASQVRGSPFADPDAPPGEGVASFYPVSANGETIEIDMGPFLGEPSLDELGELGENLRQLMREIAFRLEMPMGEYAGSFAIAAAQMIGVRAGGVADHSESHVRATRAVAQGSGNLGDVDFSPEISPAIQAIRYIAGTSPILTRFQYLLVRIYDIPRVAAMISSYRANDSSGWALDFYKTYTPQITESSGYLFIRTCQIMMLQLLRSSEVEIRARLTNMDTYYPVVRGMILGLMASEANLIDLRDRLRTAQAGMGGFSATVSEVYSSWREVRQALSTSFSQQIVNVGALTAGRIASEVVYTEQGWRIKDTDNRIWSMDELEQAIAFRHGTATSIDPLIHQFADIPDVVATFRASPQLSRWYLESLLNEMLDNNADMQSKTKSKDVFAFQTGKIREDLPSRTVPYTSYDLQGVHLLAHEAIGDAFGGANTYALGLNYAFSVEQGRQSIMAFAETVSVIALSVICPPAGMALGAAYGAMHYAEASEREQLYGSLINPELVLSRVDVEMDLFMGELEIALSIIPELGPIIRGATTAGRTVAKQGLRAGTRALSTRARKELMVSIGRQAKMGFGRALVTEVFIDRVMTITLPHLIGPLISEVHREISVLSGQPVPPRDALPAAPANVATPDSDAPIDLIHEDEAALIRRLEEYQEGSHDDNLPDESEAP